MIASARRLTVLLALIGSACLDLSDAHYRFSVDDAGSLMTGVDCVRVCDAPPARRCAGDSALGAFASRGRCNGSGGCSYEPVKVTCAARCENGACVGEPCVGVFCDTPPAPRCEDAQHARVFQAAGSCSVGSCAYASTVVGCPGGCANGVCSGNTCEGKQCLSPPSPSCLDDRVLRQFEAPGVCGAGSCSYRSRELTCADGCAGGACRNDPCAGASCNQPPSDTCVDAQTRRHFEPVGTCSAGVCSYQASQLACAAAERCESGRCLPVSASCSASSCGDGCCEGATCVKPADQSDARCGLGAATCGGCGSGYRCGAGLCVDVDECLNNNGGCGASARCTNTVGSFFCTSLDAGVTDGGTRDGGVVVRDAGVRDAGSVEFQIPGSVTPCADFEYEAVASCTSGCPVGFTCMNNECRLNGASGRAQITLRMGEPEDLDLYLVEPLPDGGSCEIYWEKPRPMPGAPWCGALGSLDVESSTDCAVKKPNLENVVYPSGPPLTRGTYEVRVNYYQWCAAAAVPYEVEVRANGVTRYFCGEFEKDEANEGKADAGLLVTRFVIR